MTWVRVQAESGVRYAAPSRGACVPSLIGLDRLADTSGLHIRELCCRAVPIAYNNKNSNSSNSGDDAGATPMTRVLVARVQMGGRLGSVTIAVGAPCAAPLYGGSDDKRVLHTLLDCVVAVLRAAHAPAVSASSGGRRWRGGHAMATAQGMLDALCTRAPVCDVASRLRSVLVVAKGGTQSSDDDDADTRQAQLADYHAGDDVALHGDELASTCAALRRACVLHFVSHNAVPVSVLACDVVAAMPTRTAAARAADAKTQKQQQRRQHRGSTTSAAAGATTTTTMSALGVRCVARAAAQQARSRVTASATASRAAADDDHDDEDGAAATTRAMAQRCGTLLLQLLQRVLYTSYKHNDAAALLAMHAVWLRPRHTDDNNKSNVTATTTPTPRVLAAVFAPAGLLLASSFFYERLSHTQRLCVSTAALDWLLRSRQCAATRGEGDVCGDQDGGGSTDDTATTSNTTTTTTTTSLLRVGATMQLTWNDDSGGSGEAAVMETIVFAVGDALSFVVGVVETGATTGVAPLRACLTRMQQLLAHACHTASHNSNNENSTTTTTATRAVATAAAVASRTHVAMSWRVLRRALVCLSTHAMRPCDGRVRHAQRIFARATQHARDNDRDSRGDGQRVVSTRTSARGGGSTHGRAREHDEHDDAVVYDDGSSVVAGVTHTMTTTAHTTVHDGGGGGNNNASDGAAASRRARGGVAVRLRRLFGCLVPVAVSRRRRGVPHTTTRQGHNGDEATSANGVARRSWLHSVAAAASSSAVSFTALHATNNNNSVSGEQRNDDEDEELLTLSWALCYAAALVTHATWQCTRRHLGSSDDDEDDEDEDGNSCRRARVHALFALQHRRTAAATTTTSRYIVSCYRMHAPRLPPSSSLHGSAGGEYAHNNVLSPGMARVPVRLHDPTMALLTAGATSSSSASSASSVFVLPAAALCRVCAVHHVATRRATATMCAADNDDDTDDSDTATTSSLSSCGDVSTCVTSDADTPLRALCAPAAMAHARRWPSCYTSVHCVDERTSLPMRRDEVSHDGKQHMRSNSSSTRTTTATYVMRERVVVLCGDALDDAATIAHRLGQARGNSSCNNSARRQATPPPRQHAQQQRQQQQRQQQQQRDDTTLRVYMQWHSAANAVLDSL